MPPPNLIFLLEDNPDRLAPMFTVFRDLFPLHQVHVEDDCNSAIAFLRDHQPLIDLISLVHDLDSVPRDESPVADFLSTRPPTCPVIIHTSNATAGDGMLFQLQRAHWPVFRVYPHDHHDWVPTDYASTLHHLRPKHWLP